MIKIKIWIGCNIYLEHLQQYVQICSNHFKTSNHMQNCKRLGTYFRYFIRKQVEHNDKYYEWILYPDCNDAIKRRKWRWKLFLKIQHLKWETLANCKAEQDLIGKPFHSLIFCWALFQHSLSTFKTRIVYITKSLNLPNDRAISV